MSSVSHVPVTSGRTPDRWVEILKISELWTSLAISTMWLAVLFAAVFGPDFVSTTPGGSTTTIPSGVAVALFAFLGSWAVAKHSHRRRDAD